MLGFRKHMMFLRLSVLQDIYNELQSAFKQGAVIYMASSNYHLANQIVGDKIADNLCKIN